MEEIKNTNDLKKIINIKNQKLRIFWSFVYFVSRQKRMNVFKLIRE